MARLFIILLSVLLLPAAAFAQTLPKPDDTLSLSLSVEDWVTTKTARTVVQVNASVTAENAGSTREAMLKAVQQMSADTSWRLINFNRSQTETGMENWYAQFEARMPEASLSGLNEKAIKLSKPGMQLSVNQIDFTPTLDETEAVRANMRRVLMDKIAAELKTANAAFPGRDFRLSDVAFGGVQAYPAAMRQRMMTMKAQGAEVAAAPMAMDSSSSGMETAQKLMQTATVTFAAVAPANPPVKQEAVKPPEPAKQVEATE